MLIPLWFVVLAAALFGAALGSFLNVCIYRLPREGMTVSSPRRSHCPTCGFTIPWHDNIPILSWILLGGRCRSCAAPISPRYLVVEALTAMLFAVLAVRYLGGPDPEPAVFAVVAALVAACTVASFIDQDHQIIPDEITLPGMMALPALALLVPGLHLPPGRPVAAALAAVQGPFGRAAGALPDALRSGAGPAAAIAVAAAAAGLLGLAAYRLYWRIVHRKPKALRDSALAGVLAAAAGGVLAAMVLRPEWVLAPRIYSFWAALAGMAMGSAIILVVGEFGRQVFRKEAMGFGDVKLMGLLGGFAGWAGVLAGFFIAVVLGSVVGIYRLIRYRTRYLPFGPWLAIGALFMVVWPEAFYRVLRWYIGLFRAGE